VHLRLVRVRERALAEAIARRLAGGADFASVARELSQDPSATAGGDLGTLPLAQLAEPLRRVAGALAPGQVSDPIETPQGFVLLKRER
jgi:parvulin-like peptidyl-prolyl isomerase